MNSLSIKVSPLIVLWLLGSATAQTPITAPSINTPASIRAHQMKGEARDLKDASRQQPASRPAQASPAPAAPAQPTGSETPQLHRAAAQGQVETVRRALDDDPSLLQQKDSSGFLLLHHAAYGGHVEIVDLLLARQVRVDSLGSRGETPLLLAASKGYPEVVEILLEKGADPNRAGSDGKTPLHKAAMEGHADVVIALLEAGADPRLKDRSGRNALDIAERYRQGDSQRVIRSLQQAIP